MKHAYKKSIRLMGIFAIVVGILTIATTIIPNIVFADENNNGVNVSHQDQFQGNGENNGQANNQNDNQNNGNNNQGNNSNNNQDNKSDNGNSNDNKKDNGNDQGNSQNNNDDNGNDNSGNNNQGDDNNSNNNQGNNDNNNGSNHNNNNDNNDNNNNNSNNNGNGSNNNSGNGNNQNNNDNNKDKGSDNGNKNGNSGNSEGNGKSGNQLEIAGIYDSSEEDQNGNGQSGTTLSAEKTARGVWESSGSYSWTINKTVNGVKVYETTIPHGTYETVTYRVSVTRISTPSTEDKYYVEGVISVTNGGGVTTENLKIVDRVQYSVGGGYQDLPGATLTIYPSELNPGETGRYSYRITFTPVDGATYRNVAKVTITNHSGSLGEEKGPEPKAAGFSFPSTPVLVKSIHVEDTNGKSWVFNDTGYQEYDVTYPCDLGTKINTATITETGQSSDAKVIIHCSDTSTSTTTTTVPTVTTTTVAVVTTTTTPSVTTSTLAIAGITEIKKKKSTLKIAGLSTENLPFTGAFMDVGFMTGSASTLFGIGLLIINSRIRRRRK